MVVENTVPNLLGLRFKLFNLSDLEIEFKKLYATFYNHQIEMLWKENSSIISIEDYLDYTKLVIVKMGYLDLTFEIKNVKNDFYLRIFMEADNAGIKFFESHPEIDFDTFVSNWRVSYQQLEKPINFTIIDACYTNALGVWSDKYFYS